MLRMLCTASCTSAFPVCVRRSPRATFTARADLSQTGTAATHSKTCTGSFLRFQSFVCYVRGQGSPCGEPASLPCPTACRPAVSTFLSLVITGLAGIGFLNFQAESDSQNIWSPYGTQARKDQEQIDLFFPSDARPNSLYVLPAKSNPDQNILSTENLRRVLELHTKVVTATASNGLTYATSCVLIPGLDACFVGGALGTWSFNPSAMFGADGSRTASQRFDDVLARYPDVKSTLGGVDRQAKTAQAIELIYVVEPRNGESEEQLDVWSEELLSVSRQEHPGLEVQTLASFSIGRELARSVGGDINLVVIGYVLMVAYSVCVITRRMSPVALRLGLALSGIFTVVLAVVAGYGIAMASGVVYTDLNLLLPLIIVAIGVDDEYVLTAAWDARDEPSPRKLSAEASDSESSAGAIGKTVSPQKTTFRILHCIPVSMELSRAEPHGSVAGNIDEDEIPEHTAESFAEAVTNAKAHALASEGMSIVFTSLTDIIAFVFGSLTRVPALHWFTLYAASTVTWVLLLSLTFFVCCLELDDRRQAAGRCDILCCVRPKQPASARGADQVQHAGTASVLSPPAAPTIEHSPSPSLQKMSCLSAIIHTYYVPLVRNVFFQAGVVAFFVAFTGFNAWALTQVKTGQPLSSLVPDDSYVLDWVNTREAVFDSAAVSDFDVFVTDLVAEPDRSGPPNAAGDSTAYSTSACAQYVRMTMDTRAALQNRPDLVVGSSLSTRWWYSAFVEWLGSGNAGLTTQQAAAKSAFAVRLVNTARTTVAVNGSTVAYPLFNAASCTEMASALGLWFNTTIADQQFTSSVKLVQIADSSASGGQRLAISALKWSARLNPTNVRNTADQVVTVFAARDLITDQGNRYDFEQRSYDTWWLFTELDAIIVDEALLNIGLASVGVVIIALLFLGSVTSALLVVAVLLLVDLALLGLIFWWDLQLNSVSVVNLILSLGLAVDYSAHIAHSFEHELAACLAQDEAELALAIKTPPPMSPLQTPTTGVASPGVILVGPARQATIDDSVDASQPPGGASSPAKATLVVEPSASKPSKQLDAVDRAIDVALTGLGTSVFNGAFSTFLALVPIAAANSNIFRTFFRMLTGTSILWGFSHGFILLPVLLIVTARWRGQLCGNALSSTLQSNSQSSKYAQGEESKVPDSAR